MRNFLRLPCFLIAGILPLSAQSHSDAKKRASAGRTAWFACLAMPEGLENPAKILAGEQITELELPAFMASEAVKIPADGILRIVRPTPDPVDPAKTKYLILAEAKIPATVREALVILDPLPKPEGDLLFRAKVQGLARFKGGDRLYINLSETNIRVRLGMTTVAVSAGQAEIYQSPKLAEPANMPTMYEFYHPERKEFSSSAWAHAWRIPVMFKNKECRKTGKKLDSIPAFMPSLLKIQAAEGQARSPSFPHLSACSCST